MYRRESSSESPIVTNPLSESESVVLAIVDAVAAIENESATSLPPLSETIDGEALETLVETTDGRLTVSFRYQGYTVVVTTERVELY